MAALICEKINMQQTNDLAACANWLTRRHELLWNEALWKDSLVAFTQTLNPTGYAVTDTWLPAKGVLLCNPIIERVVAARLDNTRLIVQRQEYYYRIDYDTFTKNGQATEFVVLPNCVWEFNSVQTCRNDYPDAGDVAAITTLDALDVDNIGVTRLALGNGAEFTTERIDAINKAASAGVNIIGTPNQITFTNLFAQAVVVLTTLNGVTTQTTCATGATITIAGRIDQIACSYPVGHPTHAIAGSPPQGQSFVGQIDLRADFSGYEFTLGNSTTIVTLAAAATNAPKRQRIRLLFIPSSTTTIRVLGKRTPPLFNADTDEPAIPAMTNCLLSFVHADMLQRARRYGQAQAIQSEAMALLAQLKQIEVVQQANNVHFEPQEGMGGQWQFNANLSGLSIS